MIVPLLLYWIVSTMVTTPAFETAIDSMKSKVTFRKVKCTHALTLDNTFEMVTAANRELGFTAPSDNVTRSQMFLELFYPKFGVWVFDKHNGTYAYAAIYKANSENIANSLLDAGDNQTSSTTMWVDSRAKLTKQILTNYNSTKAPIIFTFVRNPLSHFISGLVESFTRKHLLSHDKGGHLHIKDEVKLAVLRAKSQASYDIAKSLINGIVRFDNKQVNLLVEEKSHYGNQAHQILVFQPDLIGHLENMDKDWVLLTDYLNLGGKPLRNANDTHANHRESAGDTLGLKNHLRDLFAKEPQYLRAVCRLILVDYICFTGYTLPPECTDMLPMYLQDNSFSAVGNDRVINAFVNGHSINKQTVVTRRSKRRPMKGKDAQSVSSRISSIV